jgi:hypothetical protein
MWTDEDLRFLRAQRVSVEEALTDATMDGYEAGDAAWRAKYDRAVSYYDRELEDQRRRLMRVAAGAMIAAGVLGFLLMIEYAKHVMRWWGW